MTKAEFVSAVAAKLEVSKQGATEAIEAVFGEIVELLKAGDKLTIPSFGTFSVREKAERKGRNPKTGEIMTIPAGKSGKFSAGKGLKSL